MKMDMERETKIERLEHRWALVSYLFFYSFLYGEKCLALESADKQLKFDSSLCNTATKHQVSINHKIVGTVHCENFTNTRMKTYMVVINK